MLPWILCACLAIAVFFLSVKLVLMKKSLNEIRANMEELLSTDTNRSISISSRDPHVRRLADDLGHELAVLRRQRRRYLNGDRELKETVTNLSHDLRTPLTAICGYLDLLEREEKSEPVARYLSLIQNRTEALRTLTEELFRYSVVSSVSELECCEVNLGQVLEESLLSFCGAFEQKDITPTIRLPESPLVRVLDPSALSRVFGNIISNAVKYSDGDFAVIADTKGRIEFSNAAAALSSVDVGRLFDRFFTVDSAHHSTGLGLSIAKLLTERMGGRIEADYRDGRLFVSLFFS